MIENNIVVYAQPFGSTLIRGPSKNRSSEDGPTTNVSVRNNSLFVGANAADITGIALGGEGGNVSVNNALLYAGTNAWRCFEYALPATSYVAIDNNVCGSPNAAGVQWNGGTLATWLGATGFDAHARMVDPQFSSTTAPGYNLAPASSTSPLVNTGDPTRAASRDITGKTRDAQPDIGAHEY